MFVVKFGRVGRKFGNGDECGEVAEVHRFVVKDVESLVRVLKFISKGRQNVGRTDPLVNCGEHGLAKVIDAVGFFDEGNQRRDAAFVVDAGAEGLEDLALELIALVQELQEIVNDLVAAKERDIERRRS